MNQATLRICQARRLLAPSALAFDVGANHVSRTLKRIAEEAEVKPLKFHDLRHTFASHLAMAGVSIQKIQVLLGHSDIKQTMRYAHLHPSALSGTTDVLCALKVHAQVNGGSSTGEHDGNWWGHTDSKCLRVV